MNFFAHAYLAARENQDPRFVLGSMIPDFVGMIGARLRVVNDPVIAAGIAHHHEVDAAFHGAPLFLRLMGEAQDYLEARGLATGSSMAVGHVGVELVLDGWLATHGHRHDTFRGALNTTGAAAPEWLSREHAPRWSVLRDRLVDGTLPHAYLDAEFVASRLELILCSRPRLALRSGDASTVAAWATEARDQIHAHASALLREVLARLHASRSAAHTHR